MRQLYLDSDGCSDCKGEGWASLPIDLLEQIFREAWTPLQSPDHRVSLMTSVTLVSKLWWATFSRISFRDMIIPCSSFLPQYRRIVQQRSPVYRKVLGGIRFAQLSRSIAIQKSSRPRKHFRCRYLPDDDLLRGKSIFESVHLLNSIPPLPQLQDISIIYPIDDLGNRNIFLVYSFRIVNLDIIYTFPPSTPSIFIDAVVPVRRYKSKCNPWTPPCVYVISTSKTGAACSAIGQFLELCPDMEHLGYDEGLKGSTQMQVTANSTFQISESSVIIQGRLDSFRSRRNEKDGSTSVQGKTFGIIVETRKSSANQMHGLGGAREVHFLCRRRH